MIEKPKVIYMMGEGRSGSTILDIVLDNHPAIIGVGELWSFFTNNKEITDKCSCGKEISDCIFWTNVKQCYLGRLGTRNLKMVHNTRVNHDQLRRLPFKMVGCEGKDFAQYCSDTTAIYEVLSEISGKSVVVDSTKQVGRAFNLIKCQNLDVYIIHLVRDGRGVLWSRLRDLKREPNFRRPLWRRGPFLALLRGR